MFAKPNHRITTPAGIAFTITLFMCGAAAWPAHAESSATEPTASSTPDATTVIATGEGITLEEAKDDALRKALEQGAGVEIGSYSTTENFELIRDTIFSRASGLVTDYRILEEQDGAGGIKIVKVRAKIKKGVVASNWAEVQNVLEQIGRPGIAIFIEEFIDGEQQRESMLETQLEKKLVDIGFRVYAGQHLHRIAEKESAAASAEAHQKKLQQLAKDFRSQIYIVGTASADRAGVRNLAGQRVAMYNCSGAVKMFYTATGKLLASESITNERGGARGYHEYSPQAGKKGLESAGKKLIDQVYASVMRQWMTAISGNHEIELEVSGLTTINALKLKQKLAALEKVESVNLLSSTKGIARFNIVSRVSAEQLAEYLIQDEWTALIELTDLKADRLQAKAAGRKD